MSRAPVVPQRLELEISHQKHSEKTSFGTATLPFVAEQPCCKTSTQAGLMHSGAAPAEYKGRRSQQRIVPLERICNAGLCLYGPPHTLFVHCLAILLSPPASRPLAPVYPRCTFRPQIEECQENRLAHIGHRAVLAQQLNSTQVGKSFQDHRCTHGQSKPTQR